MDKKVRLFLAAIIAVCMSISAFSNNTSVAERTARNYAQIYAENTNTDLQRVAAHATSLGGQHELEGAEGVTPPPGTGFIDESKTPAVWVTDSWNGRIVKVYDRDGNGVADTVVVFADGLAMPVDFYFPAGSNGRRVVVSTAYGLVYDLADTNNDGIADQFEAEITPSGFGDAIAVLGNKYLIASYQGLGAITPFERTERGLLYDRRDLIWGGADCTSFALDATNQLYGANTGYREIVRINPANFKRLGFTETVAVFNERSFPQGIDFDDQNNMVVGMAEVRLYDFQSQREIFIPGSVNFVSPTNDPYQPQVRQFAKSRMRWSGFGGIAVSRQRYGRGIATLSIVNSDEPYGEKAGDYAGITLDVDRDGDGKADFMTEFLPPTMLRSKILGSIKTPKPLPF